MGQIDEGRGEIHSRKDAVAMAQHVLSEHLHTPGRRQKQAEQIDRVVVFPAPLPPSNAAVTPRAMPKLIPSTATVFG